MKIIEHKTTIIYVKDKEITLPDYDAFHFKKTCDLLRGFFVNGKGDSKVISAIQLLRHIYGFRLSDAKDIVENLLYK